MTIPNYLKVKILMISLLVLAGMFLSAQNNYKIKINDTVFEISLDKDYHISLDGKDVKFKISFKDTLTYENDLIKFNYPKDYKISRTLIQDGIEQITLVTAEGSGIVIQTYSTMNPTMLNELMINEITKESLNYGYKMKRADYKRKLKSGQEIDVDKVIMTYKDETNIYEVASIGKKDEGILIMTMLMDKEENSPEGKKLISMMWNSLIFK